MESKITQYQVTGMACGGCLNRVKSVLEPYADTVVVTLNPAIATLTNPTLDRQKLNELLAKIGEYHLSEMAD